jgi:myo-inositol-1(or 4)-monophosphatase
MLQRITIAKRAARAAGQVLINKLRGGREITLKGRRDIVTDADFAADRTIRRILLAHFPADRFISEEGNAKERERLWTRATTSNELNLWIVDPLDGTTNYSRHLYPFCVSIALYRAGAVQAGVVYDPIRQEMFAAERGRGARLNGKPIHVSTKNIFEEAVMGTEWARAPQLRRRTAAIFAKVIDQAMTGRAYGSAAISMCAVATGRMDGYIHLALAPWDVAAAALIVEEAGGKVTTPAGETWSVHSQSFVASNRRLHTRLLKFFK